MENKVYYGEYSLKHWIDLILKGNIVLPDYQRRFVWKENAVLDFIKALKAKQYVPPVTIGILKIEDKLQNLILDGQQRLTSILLAYLNLFPDREKYIDPVVQIANENDDELENEGSDVIQWTFKTYLEEKRNNKRGNYHELKLTGMTDDFFNNTFLGFSFLVPGNTIEKSQQRYYSTVFRNINIKGEKLLVQESRKSLYFLNSDLPSFFDPGFCKYLTINKISIDFVRYMALLSQYYKDKRTQSIAKYYGRKMEEYYELYIYSVAGENDSEVFADLTSVFFEKDYKSRYDRLEKAINILSINNFSSIIDADMYLFGLIYHIVFENKSLANDNQYGLIVELEKKIKVYKNNYTHKKTPSALKYLRERIDYSIKIYNRYVV